VSFRFVRISSVPRTVHLSLDHYLRHHVIIMKEQKGSLISDILFFDRLRLKCDGTCAETRFRLSGKRTSPFKSAGASVQSTAGSRGVLISGSNAGYTMFRGSVKSTGYPLHSPGFPSLPFPCVTVCHHISPGLYLLFKKPRFKDILNFKLN